MYRKIGYQRHDQEREDLKAEWKAEQRAEWKALKAMPEAPHDPRNFDGRDSGDDEFGSIEDFADFLVDDEREQFDYRELQCLNYRLEVPVSRIRVRLEGWGFSLVRRRTTRRTRGFHANNHDRWAGNPCSATSGS